MSETIILEIIGFLITLSSTLAVVKVEIKHLTKQVEKHNSVIERTYNLETNYKVLDERVKQNTNDIKRIKNKHN